MPSFTGSVTVALSSNSGGATLGGTLTVNAVGGVASFSGLSIDKAGSYTLQVTSSGLPAVTSNTVSVAPAPATQLAVITQPPSSVAVGADFGWTVAAEDAYGDVATSFAGNVTVGLSSNPGGAILGGTLIAATVNGEATFSGLTLNKAGSYSLLAISIGLRSAQSSSITVTANASPPAATTEAATSVTGTAATLNASVNPEGSTTTVSFVYGTDSTLTTGTTTTAVSRSATGRTRSRPTHR